MYVCVCMYVYMYAEEGVYGRFRGIFAPENELKSRTLSLFQTFQTGSKTQQTQYQRVSGVLSPVLTRTENDTDNLQNAQQYYNPLYPSMPFLTHYDPLSS